MRSMTVSEFFTSSYSVYLAPSIVSPHITPLSTFLLQMLRSRSISLRCTSLLFRNIYWLVSHRLPI
nr:hypothetical protein PsAHV6-020 [Psittacid alphaherpesvirus 6]